MKDAMKMLRQVQQMQARMARAQTELESETVEAGAGGGAVRVIVSGTQKVMSVTIDPAVTADTEMLQDLVVAATNEAIALSNQLRETKMKAVTGDLGELGSGLGLPPGLL